MKVILEESDSPIDDAETPHVYIDPLDWFTTRRSEIAPSTTKSHLLGIAACITLTHLDDAASGPSFSARLVP